MRDANQPPAQAPADNRTQLFVKNTSGEAPKRITEQKAVAKKEPLAALQVHRAEPTKPVMMPTSQRYSANPILAAASQLLSQLVQIKQGKDLNQLDTLFTLLTEQVIRYYSDAASNGVEHTEAEAARYVLCTVLDEAVMTGTDEHKGPWDNGSLLLLHHKKTTGGEEFFDMLERYQRTPANHLAMLELMYLCLALGFKGMHGRARSTDELEQLRDGLYRQIRHLRGEIPHQLSPHWQGMAGHGMRTRGYVSGWAVAGCMLVSLAVLYSGFAWVLAGQRAQVIKPFMELDQPVIERKL